MTKPEYILHQGDFHRLAAEIGEKRMVSHYFATGNTDDLATYTGHVLSVYEESPRAISEFRNGTHGTGIFAQGFFKSFPAQARYHITIIPFTDGRPTGQRLGYLLNPIGEVLLMHQMPLLSVLYKKDHATEIKKIRYDSRDANSILQVDDTNALFSILQEAIKKGSLERLPLDSNLSKYFKEDMLGRPWQGPQSQR